LEDIILSSFFKCRISDVAISPSLYHYLIARHKYFERKRMRERGGERESGGKERGEVICIYKR
jgi:hypothetical protein